MSDVADRADMDNDLLLQVSINNIRAQPKTLARPPKGFCYWCDEAVGPTLAYCDDSCKEDHHKSLRAAQHSKR